MTTSTTKRGVLSLLMACLLLPALSCSPDRKAAGPPEKVTLAYSTPPFTVLVDIAAGKGYFREEGLDLTAKQYSYGKLAFEELLKGGADLATVGETPFMFAVMKGARLSLVATIQTSNRNNAIVARNDRGIRSAADLRGRKIGVTFGTVGEFFMDSFLISRGISRKQVKVIDLRPEEMPAALVAGRVDAVSTWNPVLGQVENELAERASVFYDADIYTQTFSIAGGREFVRTHPGAVKKLLRALARAEAFAAEHPSEAQDLIARDRAMDLRSVRDMWDDSEFTLTLDQSLVMALEEESRWAIRNRLVPATKVPNYLDSLYLDGLLDVRPRAVGLVR